MRNLHSIVSKTLAHSLSLWTSKGEIVTVNGLKLYRCHFER